MARLIVETGEEPGREFTISGSVVIGRLKTNPVPIEDAKASREHTAVRMVGADYHVADLDSRNGTLLNGRLLRQQERLKSGDRIQIGQTILRFVEDPQDVARRAELAAQAAAPAPAVIASPPPSPPRAEPRMESKPEPRVAPPARPVATRDRGPGAVDRVVNGLVAVAVFAVAVVASRWVASFAIDRLMSK